MAGAKEGTWQAEGEAEGAKVSATAIVSPTISAISNQWTDHDSFDARSLSPPRGVSAPRANRTDA